MADDDEDQYFFVPPHEITVRQLRELLARLQDDDLLIPNRVRNLAIVRDRTYIGFINLLEGGQGVEFNDEVEDDAEGAP